MFGVDTSELLIVAVLALLVIGPKELPSTMRAVGRWVGKIRGMARHFTSGIETMIREAELEEMEKRWREENNRIMREFPTVIDAEPVAGPSPADQPQLPLAEPPPPLPEPPADYDPGGPQKKGEELP
jgi:sec-independent protein translocase protein TatB